MRALLILFLIANTQASGQDDVLLRSGNKYPEPFAYPVNFDKVYKQGFIEQGGRRGHEDYSDPLEDLPKTREEFERLLREFHKPNEFNSPQEEEEFHNTNAGGRQGQNTHAKAEKDKNTNQSRLWLDLPSIQERNIAGQNSRPPILKDIQQPPAAINFSPKGPPMEARKDKYFDPGSFRLNQDLEKIKKELNWTTCNEFGRGASFHPARIVNLEWVPFYIWSVRTFTVAIIHRFSHPTLRLVNHYKQTYGPYLDKKISWDQPKLLMVEERESLLIAADRRGLFHVIPKMDLPLYVTKNKVQIPTATIRLKIEDPYLALMMCEETYATVMAVIDNEPRTDREKTLEAETIEFRGTGRPVSRDINVEVRMALRALALNKSKNNVSKIHTDDQ